MPVKFNEADWIVTVEKEEYYLTNEEVNALKQAMNRGLKGVWFDNLYLATGFIRTITRVARKQLRLALPEPEPTTELTEEEMTKNRQRIREMMKDFHTKVNKT